MADEQTNEATEVESAPKKKSPMMTFAVVGVIMLLEAAAVIVFMKMTSGPSSASAAAIEGEAGEAEEQTVEIELINTRVQNLTTSRVWDWEIEIFLKVGIADETRVNEVLERHNAEIRDGIATIFRRAPHAQLKDPERRAMMTQVHALLDEVVGRNETDESLIKRVLIPTCDGYPADF